MDSFKRFVQEVFRNWSGQKTGGSRIKVKKIIIDPRLQNYVVLSESIGAKDFGKYTLNPEVQGLDFGQLKVFIPNLSEFHEDPIYKVMGHVMNTYGGKYLIPGIEFWKWICENPGKNMMRDKKCYFFPGSLMCGTSGYWSVPFYESWRESREDRYALWLKNLWDTSDCHVVLLKKP